MNLPTCDYCEKRDATCVGAYENDQKLRFACDQCCAHGCEDGQCWRLRDADDEVAS